ncbi:MAG: CaiB/BaiF CoA transferase family protein, partial [Gaiellales bacterium]
TASFAGPYCTMVLGSLGAAVTKIEHPQRGDDTRAWGPPFWGDESVAFLSMNANKRSLALDIKQPEGLDIALGLIEQADIFVQNMRPGLVERVGLGFEALRDRNSRLIYCSIGAFGREGPVRDQPGYDPLMQAAGGIMSITGESSERPPVRLGISAVDQGTALWSVIGILAALRNRDGGEGAQLVDTSLYETAIGWLPYQLAGYLASGVVPRPQGSGIGLIAPYEAFEAADGWVMVAAGNDRLFASLCGVLARPELADDDRFRTNPDRCAHRHELADVIREVFRTRPAGEWLGELEQAGVPAALVQDLAQVAAHPQTEAIGIIEEVEHPTVDGLRLVAAPVSVGGERASFRSPPPLFAQHTREVLEELGYDDPSIQRLARSGVVALGQTPAGA